MHQGRIIGLLVVAALAGCQQPASHVASNKSTAVAKLAGDTVIAESAAGTSETKRKGETGALLRAIFANCIDRSEGITPKMQACMQAEFDFQDARMRTAYEALLQAPSADVRRTIEQSQTDWLLQEQKECPLDARRGGQAQRLEANYCSLRNIAKRARELENKLASK